MHSLEGVVCAAESAQPPLRLLGGQAWHGAGGSSSLLVQSWAELGALPAFLGATSLQPILICPFTAQT